MQNVAAAFRFGLGTLALVELAVVTVRLRHRAARREGAWLALLLGCFAAALLPSRDSLAVPLGSAGVLAATGGLLLAIHRRPRTLAWCAVCAALVAILLVGGPAPVRVAGFVALALVPLALLYLLWRKTGEAVDFALMAAAAAWVGSSGLQLARVPIPGWIVDALAAPLLALVGFSLFEEGYLTPLTSSGYVDRLGAQRRLTRATYARLLASEDALVAQDRLIAAGLLATGASHEFKNILAAVRATAEHGLRQQDPAGKDESLRLMLEHAAVGQETAAAFLGRIGREGREEARVLDLRGLLEEVVRSARSAWRPAGIVLALQCEDHLAVRARKLEAEQVVLNLLRNAVDAFAARRPGAGEPRVRLEAARGADRVLLEVSDNAGGVPAGDVPRLFSLGKSGRGSTGIGLYLARNLAERNGGSLAYRPIEGGSCFTLELPAAD
jgi:signal transduction histidine kinase